MQDNCSLKIFSTGEEGHSVKLLGDFTFRRFHFKRYFLIQKIRNFCNLLPGGNSFCRGENFQERFMENVFIN